MHAHVELLASSPSEPRIIPPTARMNIQPTDAQHHGDHGSDRTGSEISTVQNHEMTLAPRLPPISRINPSHFLWKLIATYSRVPYTPRGMLNPLLGSSNLEDFVVAHYVNMVRRTYFKPRDFQAAPLQRMLVSRVRASTFDSWVMFIGVNICESYITADDSQNETFNTWINEVEQVSKGALSTYLTPRETQTRMANWLDIVFLKTMVMPVSYVCQVLRSAAAVFLQMAFSDPTIWPSHSDPTLVPLANVVSSPHGGFSYFPLMDVTTAMVFGFPQQVEYNTSLGCPTTASVAHERMHSIPLEFQITLAEINACRDKSANAPNWEKIEHKLTTWQTRPSEYDPYWESHVAVAWFAVQESWRLTLLVYLYLSVCGASSDDRRIQSSVQQIFQVIDTVKKPDSSHANVPFFAQYLMAGICARSEKHRSIVRKHLSDVSGTKFWLMRGVDFAPVLDDLWHGAAVDGRPVKWKDYCDLRQPTCERCEKGGFECLGYNRNKRGITHPSPAPSRQRSILPNQETTQSLYRAASIRRPDETEIGFLDSETPVSHLTPTSSPPTAQFLRILSTHYNRIPYTPYHLSRTLLDSSNLEDYVTSHCERVIEWAYFKPLLSQTTYVQNLVVSRIRSSGFTRWVMFVCARIFESFVKGDTSQNETYNLWINQMEQVAKVTLSKYLGPNERQDRLANWLDILLLKTMVVRSSDTYRVLREAAPAFLQLAFSQPTLWSSTCDPTSIPLMSTIASPHHGFAYFALMDITAATVFGLPQQVEYNTSFDGLPTSLIPHECVHSTPLEFQLSLAEINACRDKSPNARSWEEIERKLLSWQVHPSKYDASWESWMVIAWFAVQESWRHTLLVYLYLSVCGASSDDPRVQSSVRQVLQVVNTVKKPESLDVTVHANVPFFIQYLMVGICTRSEKQRSLVREQLASVSDPKCWLIRAVDFVPVLDDLWRGAAVNGRPITWSDYLYSRERALPMSL